jgi:hypothetical protein
VNLLALLEKALRCCATFPLAKTKPLHSTSSEYGYETAKKDTARHTSIEGSRKASISKRNE